MTKTRFIISVVACFAAVSGSIAGVQARTPGAVARAAHTAPVSRHAAATAHAAGRGRGPIVGLIASAAQWVQPSQRLAEVIPRTGAKWLREGFYWKDIEPAPGRFVFGHYDQFMLLAARRHVHVLALLYTAPAWAAATPISVPADPSRYAAFVAAVVHRYGPHGTLWKQHPRLRGYAVSTVDLWNEPYYDNGNAGRYDPARYARLVKAAGTAAHATDRSIRILIGAEMQGTLVRSNWLWWVNALYRAVPDLNRYFDGVSVHPYGIDITHRSPATVGRPYFGYDQMRRIELIRAQFVHHGAASKPFWADEVGWPTCVSGSDRCTTTAGQVRSLNTLMHYATTRWRSYVRAVFIYYFDDGQGGPRAPESDYGLTYANHAAKPVLAVFRRYAQRAPAQIGRW